MGEGDWGLGIGDWGLGTIPSAHSTIGKTQSAMKYFLNFKIWNTIKIYT